MDEGLPPRQPFGNLNDYLDIKHIAIDYNLKSILDTAVYDLACEEKRILVTYNSRHFKKLVKANCPSIIGLSMKLSNDQIDKKLMKICTSLRKSEFEGNYFFVAQ